MSAKRPTPHLFSGGKLQVLLRLNDDNPADSLVVIDAGAVMFGLSSEQAKALGAELILAAGTLRGHQGRLGTPLGVEVDE